MKFWIGPLVGALIAGAYGMFRLSEQWNVGGEHAFRASGTLLAYVLMGVFIWSIISGFLFAIAQSAVSGSVSSSEETKRLTDPLLSERVGPTLFDTAVVSERRRLVSHLLPDKTKVQRIQPQIDALRRALDAQLGFAEILQVLCDARGAINDLSAELVADYIQLHVDTAQDGMTDRTQAVQELVDAMRSFLK
jgi:DNA-binding FrmR family transcriptional regulator